MFKHDQVSGQGLPAPVNYKMGEGVYGSFDGYNISLKKSHKNKNQLLKGNFYVPQQSAGVLKREEMHGSIPNDSLFMFSKNKVDFDCCPSTFTTSRGCVCTTQKQIDMITKYRGGNKTHWDEYF